MKCYRRLTSQDGFTLVQAIFILVVLALIGVAMVHLLNIQSATSVFALQGTRAYQAARSGLEWGAARAAAGDSCSGTLTVETFTVTVSCSSQTYTEGSVGPYDVYWIQARAEHGSYGSADYISRQAEMKVGFP